MLNLKTVDRLGLMSQTQWQPTRFFHDPNPPITLQNLPDLPPRARVLQVVQTNTEFIDTPTGTTEAVSLHVTAGSTLAVFVTWGYTTTAETTTCADNVNAGNYTAAGTLDDTTGSQASAAFYLKRTAGGRITVTATFGSAKKWRSIWVVELAGVKNYALIDGNAAQLQVNPGTGADAVTTGTSGQSPTYADSLLLAWSMNVDTVSAPSVGTGFYSKHEDTTVVMARIESKVLSASGAVAATFKAPVDGTYMSMSMVFDAAVPDPDLHLPIVRIPDEVGWAAMGEGIR